MIIGRDRQAAAGGVNLGAGSHVHFVFDRFFGRHKPLLTPASGHPITGTDGFRARAVADRVTVPPGCAMNPRGFY
jgi:hypothetical protein